MPSKNHSSMFPEFIIHLGPNWDNFVVQNSSMLGKINIISLEPKTFCVLNGIHLFHKNNWYYMNLGSIRRKLVQVAQRNRRKCLLQSSVLPQTGFWWKMWFKFLAEANFFGHLGIMQILFPFLDTHHYLFTNEVCMFDSL